MTAELRKLESLGRRSWPPIFLSLLFLLTWAVIENVNSAYWTDVAVTLFLTLIVVLGLQIFSGNSGVVSFGHVAFMAIGAYTSALLTMPTAIKQFTFPTMPHFLKSWIFPAHLGALEGTLIGGGFALVFALITAAPIARLAGMAAGIATLAIIVIVNVFASQTPSVTNGTASIIGVPLTTTLLSVTVWAVIFVFVAFAFQRSRVGLRLRASRENRRAAQSVGVRVTVERAIAWTLSGFVVGVAGALYGHYFITFSPSDFYFNNGLNIVVLTVAMLVVGGMTSVTGAVVGCYVVTIVYSFFSRWEVSGFFGVTPPSGTSNLALSLLLLGVLILRPGGLTGGREITWPTDWNVDGLWRRRRAEGRSAALAAEPAPDEQIAKSPAASPKRGRR